jgi:hypothetical protein
VNVGEVSQAGRGFIPRQGVIVFTVAVVVVLLRDRLRGRLCQGNPVDGLLAPKFLQRLRLLGLADRPLLGRLLDLLLLGRVPASSLLGGLVLWDWRPCLPQRRQILRVGLDQISEIQK